MSKKEIQKVHAAYSKAAGDMVRLRSSLFPEGTKVYQPLTETRAVIEKGSLYPDQVYTNKGHMSWHSLQIVKE